MSNAPKEITTPPEGWEWVGIGSAGLGDVYAQFVMGHWEWSRNMGSEPVYNVPLLRKVKPPTVMVELPRDVVEFHAASFDKHEPLAIEAACHEALAREDAE